MRSELEAVCEDNLRPWLSDRPTQRNWPRTQTV